MTFLRSFSAMLLFLCFICCGDKSEPSIDPAKLSAMGRQYKEIYTKSLVDFEAKVAADSTDVDALLGSAEMQVYLYIFGLSSRASTMPEAKEAFAKALGQGLRIPFTSLSFTYMATDSETFRVSPKHLGNNWTTVPYCFQSSVPIPGYALGIATPIASASINMFYTQLTGETLRLLSPPVMNGKPV